MRLNVYKIKHSNYSIGFLFQVHFPDVERVEWLNKVPYVCVCVCVCVWGGFIKIDLDLG